MSTRIAEHVFNGATGSISAYSTSATLLGTLMRQGSGANTTDYWVGPMPIGIARPSETAIGVYSGYPQPFHYDDTTDWIFLNEISTASIVRRIMLFEYNKKSSEFNWRGYVGLSFPLSGNNTVVGFRASLERYTTGTISANGISAFGLGTSWIGDGLAEGSRIGFHTTDYASVSSWFEINTIKDDTQMILNDDVGTITSGTAYVIEDLRFVTVTTNSVVGNGGVYLTKGINFNNFAVSGNFVESSSKENGKGTTVLLDNMATGVTGTNNYAVGCAIGSFDSWNQQYLYVLDHGNTTTSHKIYKYNIRASLSSTLNRSRSTDAFVLSTGLQATLVTRVLNNNGIYATFNHGPGNGIPSFYFVTTTRVYRANISDITNGSTTWISDMMVEIPPGGITTYPLYNVFASVDDATNIDKLIIVTSGAGGARSYITSYNSIADPFDHEFLIDTKQYDQSSSDSRTTPQLSINAVPFHIGALSGISYLVRANASVANNQLYAVPISVDWTYASITNQRVITPKIDTPNNNYYNRVHASYPQYMGIPPFDIPVEPFRIYYRTLGIDDNTGTWNMVNVDGSLSGLQGSTSIQFMLEFKIIGSTCLPSRVYSLAVSYEDDSTDSHYQPSVSHSSTATKAFAWRFSTAYGGTVPTMRVKLYDAVAGTLLVNDTSTGATGSWEKSTDNGTVWGAYDTTDKTNDTTYIRYIPASLSDDIKVKGILLQA